MYEIETLTDREYWALGGYLLMVGWLPAEWFHGELSWTWWALCFVWGAVSPWVIKDLHHGLVGILAKRTGVDVFNVRCGSEFLFGWAPRGSGAMMGAVEAARRVAQ